MLFIYRGKQNAAQLGTADSSGEESDDDNESVGSMDFPEYVSSSNI